MLSESLLSSITDAVFSFLPEQTDITEKTYTWLGHDPQRLIFQTALVRTYVTFDLTYPQWTKTFFDTSFLKDCAAPLLARCLMHDQTLAPAELVTAWANYMRLPVEQQLMVQLISPATDFLYMLNIELQKYTEYHSLFNSLTS